MDAQSVGRRLSAEIDLARKHDQGIGASLRGRRRWRGPGYGALPADLANERGIGSQQKSQVSGTRHAVGAATGSIRHKWHYGASLSTEIRQRAADGKDPQRDLSRSTLGSDNTRYAGEPDRPWEQCLPIPPGRAHYCK